MTQAYLEALFMGVYKGLVSAQKILVKSHCDKQIKS